MKQPSVRWIFARKGDSIFPFSLSIFKAQVGVGLYLSPVGNAACIVTSRLHHFVVLVCLNDGNVYYYTSLHNYKFRK